MGPVGDVRFSKKKKKITRVKNSRSKRVNKRKQHAFRTGLLVPDDDTTCRTDVRAQLLDDRGTRNATRPAGVYDETGVRRHRRRQRRNPRPERAPPGRWGAGGVADNYNRRVSAGTRWYRGTTQRLYRVSVIYPVYQTRVFFFCYW